VRIYTMTATFGKLEHETLTLNPGLNIIHAPNEWGKSTWCAFLVSMLYGIDTGARASKGILPDKTRYAPWSGKPMSGRIDLSWQGRDITIERSSKGRIPMGQFSAYETHTHVPVPELTAANCGQQLLGVERSVFTRAGFIKFSDLPLTQDESLRRRLNALVTTGDESGASDDLAIKLKNLKNSCRHNKTGKLPQAEAQRDALQNALNEIDSLQVQTLQLQARQEELTSRKKALLNHRDALLYAQSRNYTEQVATARAKRDLCRQHLQTLQTQCDALPTPEALERSLSQLQLLREQREMLQQETQTLPAAPQMPNVPAPFLGMTAEQAVSQTRADHARYQDLSAPHQKPSLLLPLLGVGAILCGIVLLLCTLTALGLPAIGIGLILAIWGAIRMSAARKEAAAKNTQLQMLLQQYAPLPPEQWVPSADGFSRAQLQYQADLAAYRQCLQDLDQRRNLLNQQIQAATEGTSLLQQERSLLSARELHKSCALAQRELRQAEELLQTLSANQKTVPAPEFPDNLTFSEAETARLLSEGDTELQRIQHRFGQLQGQIQALGSPDALRQRLLLVTARISKLEEYYSAICLALAKLEEASTQLQRRFAPQITKDAKDLFHALTGGRYTRLTLGADLNLNVATEEEDTLYSTQFPSDGTVDQLYLALRLAVANALTPDAPLVLDDALVRFDDTRLVYAMQVLSQQAHTKQVLLFTCQSREHAPQSH